MKLALGRLGWTEDVFYNSTLRAFLLAIEAKDAADKYRHEKWSWELRNHAILTSFGHSGKKIMEYWPHPWDKDEKNASVVTEEAIERMKEVFRKWDEIEAKENGISSGH